MQQEVLVYGIKTLSIDDLDQVLGALIARRSLLQKRQKEQTKLELDIASMEADTRHQLEQINKDDTELKKQRRQLADLQRKCELQLRERQGLFGDKNCDDEELRISTAIDAAERNLEGFHQALSVAKQNLVKLKTQMEGLEESIGKRSSQLKKSEKAFLSRLGIFCFEDELTYVAACLSEEERKKLTDKAQKLTNENTEIESKERDKITKLGIERKKQITDQSREEVTEILTSVESQLKELQQEIGGIHQILKTNEIQRKQHQDKVQAVEAQQREFRRWDILHELIGSVDGKKYRNFAQGLTFERMIQYANKQLKKMTDRYLLIRDEVQPLALSVIDSYQAGEIRSTKNLSGGEGFLVSLSLALGLSHMSSKNIRVDSLFLDEGFGTLDEEALDTAVNTLAGLQQEGKLIGVISHVQALKERIGTQINVQPLSGGRSQIVGPGCKKIKEIDKAS